MNFSNTQCTFFAIFFLAGLLYLFMTNTDISIKERYCSPSLEYCVQTYFSKAQEICSINETISSSGNGSPSVTTKMASMPISTSTSALNTKLSSAATTTSTILSSSTVPSTTSSTSKVTTSAASSTSSTVKTSTQSTQTSTSTTSTHSITSQPASTTASTSSTNQMLTDPESIRWRSCPQPDKGRDSIILGALVEGRLGNVVWSYLSVLITARMFNLRPTLHNTTIQFLVREAFDVEHIRIPTIEYLDVKCNMKGWLDTHVKNISLCKTFYSRREVYNALEVIPKTGLEMYRYSYFVTTTEWLIPHWNELKKELVLKMRVRIEAQKQLQEIKRVHLEYLKNKGHSHTDVVFVGVHVRRTDYLHHMDVIFKHGKIATPKFFHSAMDWFVKELNQPLVFVVVSDDRNWTKANIVANRKDVYLGGTGNIEDPGVDLAILGACNHSIFAYGTFGLTGAFLASRPGAFTIIFDPENGTVTKEMEFASNLPGWRIMTEDGAFRYRENPINPVFYGHSPVTNGLIT